LRTAWARVAPRSGYGGPDKLNFIENNKVGLITNSTNERMARMTLLKLICAIRLCVLFVIKNCFR